MVGRVLVYTSKEKLRADYPDYEIIEINDAYFEEEERAENFDNKCWELAEKIDGITFTDGVKSQNSMTSRFGPLKISELSTGCKTAINLYKSMKHKKKVIISLIECGNNAILECFKLIKDKGVPVLLEHNDFYFDDNFIYNINGVKTSDKISTLIASI